MVEKKRGGSCGGQGIHLWKERRGGKRSSKKRMLEVQRTERSFTKENFSGGNFGGKRQKKTEFWGGGPTTQGGSRKKPKARRGKHCVKGYKGKKHSLVESGSSTDDVERVKSSRALG